ncbi:MAG: GDP-L-fucose synthase [Nitrospiraceae bacterium]|nr:MAG: GDP-L-fucose synthase [Nitrospiraceae bacterium]
MKDLLVTGGTGLLGSALRALFPEAIYVSRRTADLRDRAQVVRLFERVRPRRVVHLAAYVGGVAANAHRNAELFADNALINTNVLSAAHRYKVERLVAVLSSCAFPPYQDRPATELDLHAGLPYDGNLGYGYAKRMLDLHVHLVARQSGWLWTSITPVTMYGPYDNFDLEDGHVVGALIHRCWLAKCEGAPLRVWGSGRAVRQFVFVEDVARVLAATLESACDPDTVIVAPDDGISIERLAEGIARAMDFRGPILFDRERPEGVRVRLLHSTRFRDRHPEFVFTDLAKGLRRTIEWFVQNRTMRKVVEPAAMEHV